jgi:hypothetical protein
MSCYFAAAPFLGARLMDDLIDLINSHAQDLLEQALEFEAASRDPGLDIGALSRSLTKLCSTLTSAIDQLERKRSPLRRLIRMIDGTHVCHTMARLSQYIADHQAVLVRLQVPPPIIERVVTELKDEATTDDNALDKPQTLQLEDAIEPLKQFRKIVCELADKALVARMIANPTAILGTVVTGTIGAATIVLDITVAVSASHLDPIGWTLLKAVKSIWAGVSRVKMAIKELTVMLNALRDEQTKAETEARRERLREMRPPPALRHDPVDE